MKLLPQLLFLSILFSPSVFASPIEAELRLMERELGRMEYELDQMDIEEAVETNEELFPQALSGELLPIPERVAEEEKGFVTIKEHGVSIKLSDVPLSLWFAPYVRDIAERGIVSGYRNFDGTPKGEFGPGDNITIEQMAKIVVEAAGVNLHDCGEDLKNGSASGSWAAPYIRCAEYERWAIFSDGSVDLKRDARRGELIVTILQAYGVEFDLVTGDRFLDVTASTEFAPAIETAARDYIVSGYNDEEGLPTGLFGPMDPVTRAEVAKIVSLSLQVYGGG